MADAVPSSAKKLIGRLPRTFAPALNEQFQQWDLLFPAEQRQIQAQIDWLSRLPSSDFQKLFASVFAIEKKMDLPAWTTASAGMTVREVGVLARSPHYPQWRTEVAKVFAHIDEAVGRADAQRRYPRLVLCVLPPGLPLATTPLWPDLEKDGTWIGLDKPFGEMMPRVASALAARKLADGMNETEGTWVVECGTEFSALSTKGATVLSWTAIAPARREFLKRLNTISRDLHAVDRTNEDLKRLDIGELLGPAAGSRPRVREFVRSVLLSGNGSLVFNNSFVQWTAAEALRRAQPQALIAAFGIRPKLKPFSSVVLFEDQSRSNPTPDADDPTGSLLDGMMLAQYVHLSAQRFTAYQGRTVTLLASCDLKRLLLIRPKDGPNVPSAGGIEALTRFALEWLG